MIKEIIGSAKGGAYTTALIVALTVTLLLALVIDITRYERIISDNYNKHSSCYTMAVSGAEHGLTVINDVLAPYADEIYAEVMDILRCRPLNDTAVYEFLEGNRYNGSFRIKSPDIYAGLVSESAVRYVGAVIKDLSNSGVFGYGFTITFDDEQYDVTVGITAETITAAAKRMPGGVKSTVSAELCYTPDLRSDTIYPAFRWKNMTEPEAFKYAVYSTGSIINNGAEISNALSGAPALPFDTVVLMGDVRWAMYGTDWSPDRPFAISFTDTDWTIKPGELYDGGSPVDSFIIDAGGGRLTISSDGVYDTVNGLIVSYGEVVLDGVCFVGSVFSDGDITINGGSVDYAEDAVFKMIMPDREMYHMLLDYLCITDFKSAEKPICNDIEAILKNAALSGDWELENAGFDEIQARMVKLSELE